MLLILDDIGIRYADACYDSALKAYRSLMEDGHSGMSIGMTKHVLMTLIDRRPLTPITEEEGDDIWNLTDENDKYKHYQCKRMSSLFKEVYPDGRVTYNDVDRIIWFEQDGIGYHGGEISNKINKTHPVKLPYQGQTIKVFIESYDLLNNESVRWIKYINIDNNISIPINEFTYFAKEYPKGKKIDKDMFDLLKQTVKPENTEAKGD